MNLSIKDLECWTRQILFTSCSKTGNPFIALILCLFFSVLPIPQSDFEICKEESLAPFINIYLHLCSFSVNICGVTKKKKKI